MYAIKFNTIVNEIIAIIEKKAKTAAELGNIDTLKRRIRLLKSATGPEFICEQSLPVFVKYKEQIKNKEESFFMGLNIASECSHLTISTEDEFIFTLINQMREYYKKTQQSERDILWSKVHNLFELSLLHSLQ